MGWLRLSSAVIKVTSKSQRLTAKKSPIFAHITRASQARPGVCAHLDFSEPNPAMGQVLTRTALIPGVI